eukprot:3159054-Prymnesium_polylepis.1
MQYPRHHLVTSPVSVLPSGSASASREPARGQLAPAGQRARAGGRPSTSSSADDSPAKSRRPRSLSGLAVLSGIAAGGPRRRGGGTTLESPRTWHTWRYCRSSTVKYTRISRESVGESTAKSSRGQPRISREVRKSQPQNLPHRNWGANLVKS